MLRLVFPTYSEVVDMNTISRCYIAVVMFCFGVFVPVLSIAEIGVQSSADTSMSALDIVKRAEKNATGFSDMTNRVIMSLVDEDGNVSEREMVVKTIALGGGESRTLTLFTKPSREKGIALLTHSHKSDSDEQWLYLPASKRVKKIASSNVGSSFRGSEFTYEDISNQRRDNYRFDLVTTEACGVRTCFVIDRVPNFDESSYSRTRLYIDKEQYLLQKGEFFDKGNQLLKMMTISDYTMHANGVWKPGAILMKNRQNTKSTELRSLDLHFNIGLKEKDFTKLSLRKIR